MWSHKNMVVFASIRGGPVEAYLEREDGTKEMVAFDAPSITNAEERWSQMSERPEQLASGCSKAQMSGWKCCSLWRWHTQ